MVPRPFTSKALRTVSQHGFVMTVSPCWFSLLMHLLHPRYLYPDTIKKECFDCYFKYSCKMIGQMRT